MTASHAAATPPCADPRPVTYFGPDFPFAYDDWLRHPAGLGALPAERNGSEVAIVGAGMAGMTAAYELMRLGLKPVLYEAGRLGGRLRSQPFEGAAGLVAELGGMRFPVSSTAFFHYLDRAGLETLPFPNPLAPTTPSTVIDLDGDPVYAERAEDLPPLLREVGDAWCQALEEGAGLTELQQAIRARDTGRLKRLWNALVPIWDDRSFYDFVATSRAFAGRSFRHRELFGQVGFGTGGWDTDFPNSMLEILRVVITDCDENQRLVVGGVEQLPRRMWRMAPEPCAHWPAGTTLERLHGGAPRPGVARIEPGTDGRIAIVDRWGDRREYPAVLVTCQSWLLTTHIACAEELFSHPLWMALDRTRYMQSAKTFVMVDRPFWRERDSATGRYRMSMTLSDRLTRGTYLFDQGQDKPGVICLSYSWMGDAQKLLTLPVDRRVKLMLDALRRNLSRARAGKAHHRRPDHRLLGERPQLPRHLQGRFARALPLQSADVLPLHAEGPAARRARHLPGRRRHLLDARLGRRCRDHRAQRGLGHPAPSGRPLPREQSRPRRLLRRPGPDRAPGLSGEAESASLHAASQSITARPSTRANSRALFVTSVRPRALA